ncbi:MAG TPA: efflux RND transporter periplasmic adaptor subunit, partial [Firmicutes bacterium]|nr:efflux RND transporter periplasmic adaptor subunit [Bacillota bacterium]
SAALSAASSTENQARAARLAAQAADSQVEQARATMEKMEVDYNRFLNLREEGVATQAEFEQIELGYNSARLGYEAAFAGAEAAWAQARAAELGVEAAFKQASQIAELIDDGTLRAPFDGRIATKSLDQGTIAGPGMPVYKIVGDGEETGNQLEIGFRIPEVIFGKTYIGMPIYINLLSCEREIQTAINSMGPEVREGGRTVEVISYIPLDSLCLLPGMFGTVKIPLESRENVIKLPDEAVIELETEQFVYLAEGDKAVKRVVTLGLREAGFIEIVDGLTGNEDVIVIGNRYLTDGAKITLRTAGSDSVNAQGEPD